MNGKLFTVLFQLEIPFGIRQDGTISIIKKDINERFPIIRENYNIFRTILNTLGCNVNLSTTLTQEDIILESI